MTKLVLVGIVFVPYGKTVKDVADDLYEMGPKFLKSRWEGEYYSDGPYAVHGDNVKLFNKVKE